MASSGLETISALGPFAILVAAVVGLIGVLITVRTTRRHHHEQMTHLRREVARLSGDSQQQHVDRDRSEWWERVAWALGEATSDTSERRELGLDMLPAMIESSLGAAEDKVALGDIISRMLDRRGGPSE